MLQSQVITEALPTLAKLKAQGKVRAVGFSCLPLATMKYVLDQVPQGMTSRRLLVVCVVPCSHTLPLTMTACKQMCTAAWLAK
jgi:hypothetical protein